MNFVIYQLEDPRQYRELVSALYLPPAANLPINYKLER